MQQLSTRMPSRQEGQATSSRAAGTSQPQDMHSRVISLYIVRLFTPFQ